MDRSSSMYRPLMMGLVLFINNFVEAQTDVAVCAGQLSPCLNYLNSTNPPNLCCNPIRDLSTQQNCLCQFLFTPGVLEGFGTNFTQALRLGHHCGVNIDVTICKAPSPSAVPPPMTIGGDEASAGRVIFTGLLPFMLLLFWAYELFN